MTFDYIERLVYYQNLTKRSIEARTLERTPTSHIQKATKFSQ